MTDLARQKHQAVGKVGTLSRDLSAGVRPKTTQEVFTQVAGRYDRINRVMSLGLDQSWRRKTIRSLEISGAARVLDLGAGTGRLSEAALTLTPDLRISALDVNGPMLEVLRTRRRPVTERAVECLQASAEHLPFVSCSHDGVASAFVLDDLENMEACLRECYRVLHPGGRIAILLLSSPRSPLVRRIISLLMYAATSVAAVVSGGKALGHLRQEVTRGTGSGQLTDRLISAGFCEVATRRLFPGPVILVSARRGTSAWSSDRFDEEGGREPEAAASPTGKPSWKVRFQDIFPSYLAAHGNPLNRWLHVIGMEMGFVTLGYAVYLRNVYLAPGFVGMIWLFGWTGHFLVERNRPAGFRRFFWAIPCDFALVWYVLRGRMAELDAIVEMAAVKVGHRGVREDPAVGTEG